MSMPPHLPSFSSQRGLSSRTRPSLMRRSLPILWGVVILLLILNLGLLYGLNQARLAAVEALTKVDEMLSHLSTEVIIYNVELRQGVPIKADVPIQRTIEVPLNTVIPIDQTLTVPFQTPGGEIELDLPVKANFPIDMTVPVDLDETIEVDTVVELNTAIPVEIAVARTPLLNYLSQARQDIARLKGYLTLQSEPVVLVDPVLVSSASTTGEISPAHPQAVESSNDVAVGVEKRTPEEELSVSTGSSPCLHPYWPLEPGTTWTYNSPNGSYTQRVDHTVGNKVYLTSQYEGQDVSFVFDCASEAGGVSALANMRRLAEFGEFTFSEPEGLFLPDPARLTQSGESWTQAYQVSGTVMGRQGNTSVTGQISDGRAEAVLTTAGVETVDTPLGPREAIRLEQKLSLDLAIEFEMADQVILANESIELTDVYWLAEGLGPVKVQWQGGTLQQSLNLNNEPTSNRFEVPALIEEQLAFVCLMFQDGAFECKYSPGVAQSDLNSPALSELSVGEFILPAVSDVSTSGSTEQTEEPTSPAEPTTESNQPLVRENPAPIATPEADSGAALLQYALIVAEIIEQISAAAEPFQESALAYRDKTITLEEFQQSFDTFSPKAEGLIQQMNQLSPPAEAQSIHQELTGGLAKCEQGLDMLDSWFDTFDDGLKEPATLLVVGCLEG